MIDAYLDELQGALRGPRGARADLLAEARDSLFDAAEHYERDGLDRHTAERRAVDEFGTVDEIAPEFQTELGLAQARRTALLVFAVVAAQTVLSEVAWRGQAPQWNWQPPEAYMFLARFVDYASYTVLGGALLAALACGIGTRFVSAGRRFVRATGVGAIAACAFFAVGGTLLTVYSPMGVGLPDNAADVAIRAVTLVLPAWIVYSGSRCLRAAA